MSKAERMSSVDTAWLRMDRPANPMVILSLLIIEGPVDCSALEAVITERFLSIPRFKQRVETRLNEHWWVDDPHFDEARHIQRVRLPGKADEAELQRYAAHLASEPLDKSRPLWQLHIVEDYDGGAVLIIRIHHAIADGMALVAMMLSLTDGGDRRAWTPKAKTRPEKSGWFSLPGVSMLQKGIGATATFWKEVAPLVAEPAKAARLGVGLAGELAWLATMPEDSATRLKGKPSGNKRVAWTDPIALEDVKPVGKALGCTVNDVLLSSVAGAFRRYLQEKGDTTRGVEIRALIPVDMRKTHEAGQLGNRFGIVGVELPVGIGNPVKRAEELHRRMSALKHSLEPPVTLGMFAVLGHAPQAMQDSLFNLLTHRATAVMTNVPGPQSPLYFGGAKIKQIMFWVPQSGDIGIGVSILSYNGGVQFGLITDAEMVPDPQAVIKHFRPEFDELLYHVLMSPWGDGDGRPNGQTFPETKAMPPSSESRNATTRTHLKKAPALANAAAAQSTAGAAHAPQIHGEAVVAPQKRARVKKANAEPQAVAPLDAPMPERHSEAVAAPQKRARAKKANAEPQAVAALEARMPERHGEAVAAPQKRARIKKANAEPQAIAVEVPLEAGDAETPRPRQSAQRRSENRTPMPAALAPRSAAKRKSPRI